MDKAEFETELRRDGYRIVNSSVKPNLIAPNHCHDFDAKPKFDSVLQKK